MYGRCKAERRGNYSADCVENAEQCVDDIRKIQKEEKIKRSNVF